MNALLRLSVLVALVCLGGCAANADCAADCAAPVTLVLLATLDARRPETICWLGSGAGRYSLGIEAPEAEHVEFEVLPHAGDAVCRGAYQAVVRELVLTHGWEHTFRPMRRRRLGMWLPRVLKPEACIKDVEVPGVSGRPDRFAGLAALKGMWRLGLMTWLMLAGCATRPVLRDEAGFTARDYLKTAYDTLLVADPDTAGHRIRAELETRAALEALGGPSSGANSVPFEGPPTLRVAQALLEESTTRLSNAPAAQSHARVALAELREALR